MKALLKSKKDVGSKYQDGFITAGMGGGTGTGGATPINCTNARGEILLLWVLLPFLLRSKVRQEAG
jgi:cell division GTPase FtsZ